MKETTELVEQSVYFVPKAVKPQLLTALLSQSAITRALVFMRTKHSADRVTKQLNRAGLQAEAIHGNKSQAARLRTLANFKSIDCTFSWRPIWRHAESMSKEFRTCSTSICRTSRRRMSTASAAPAGRERRDGRVVLRRRRAKAIVAHPAA